MNNESGRLLASGIQFDFPLFNFVASVCFYLHGIQYNFYKNSAPAAEIINDEIGDAISNIGLIVGGTIGSSALAYRFQLRAFA
jgi:hypothetical protein